MKTRRLTLLIAIFAIMTMLFVSCNSDVTSSSAVGKPDEELVYASFTDNSKALSFSYDVPAYDKLYWRYSAVKKDAYGTVGQTWNGGTSEEKFVPVPTAATTPTKGLDGKVGPFSQGTWDFKLQAFRNCTKNGNTLVFSDQVFEGTATNVVLNKNQTNYIAVTVTPAGDTGKIKISDAYYEWASVASAGSAQVKLVVTLVGRPEGSNSEDPVTYTYSEVLTKETSENKYKFNGVGGYIAIPEPEPSTDVTTAIPAGVYTATFKIVEDTETPTIDEFVLQTFSLKVYGGLETIVTGNLTEGLSYENYFSVPEQTIASTTANSSGAASMSVDMTPASTTSATMKTIVEFPENSLSSNTQHTLSVEVTNIETAETQFNVTTKTSNAEAAVAAIGLNLTKTTVTTNETTGEVTDTTTEPVSDFNGQYVTIKTYIQSGLTGTVTVMYDGDGEQPRADVSKTRGATDCNVAATLSSDSGLGYNPATGYLSFETNHFSEFYVKTNVEALNVSSGRYYPSLASALDAALDGQTIKILKNITQDKGFIIDKSLNLDTNGKTITVTSGSNCNNRAFMIEKGTFEVYGNGTIVAQGSGTTSSDGAGCYGAFRIESNGNLVASNLTLTNARPWGLNVKVLGGTANLTNVTITSSYGGGIEVTEADLGTHSKTGSATLTNCTFTQTGYFDHCSTPLSVSGGSELIVNGGTYTSENHVLYVFSSGGVITVNNGSFNKTAQNSKAGIVAAIDTNTYPQYTGGFKINGGVFTCDYSITSPAYMSITGGTFDHDPSAYVAPGYYAKENTPYAGWWTVDSIFDGSGTEDDPYIIDGIDGWMELVHMCENDSTFASTNGKYFKMTSDVDVSSKTERATVHYFAGHIDFSGYTLCGFNSNNTVPGDVGDDGIVAAFSIVSGDVSISNLVYEINSITNTQTVHNQLVGKTPYYADGVKLVFDNVTVNGLATGVSGNNHSPLFAHAYNNTNLTISCKNCTNNATIIGSGYKAAFIGNLSYIKSGVLTFDTCINNGVIVSTDSPASMLVSNGDSYYSDASISFVINDSVNNGVISGKSNYAGLVMGMLNSTSSYKDIYRFNNDLDWNDYISDKSLNGELAGSDVAIISTTTIGTNVGCFVLSSTESAKYYQLHFSFSASSHAGGNVGYVVEFGNKSQQFTGDLPSDVAVSSWVDDDTKTGNVTEYNIPGATSGVLYKDSEGHYVFNESGSRLRDKVLVSFIAYGENNQVLSIATYQY